ncbi:MAG: hypothetical protein K2Z81_02745, partial [Cyanobacteria bacterium]|nr:hypothetical protein [Cyanobacteriota bacterium]
LDQLTILALTRSNMVPVMVLDEDPNAIDGRAEGLYVCAVVALIVLLNALLVFSAEGFGQFALSAMASFAICWFYMSWLNRAAIMRYCRKTHTVNLPVPTGQALSTILNGLTSPGMPPWEQCSTEQVGNSSRVVVSRSVSRGAGTVLIGDILIEPSPAGSSVTVAFIGNASSGFGYMLWNPAESGLLDRMSLPGLMRNTINTITSTGIAQQYTFQRP